MGKVHHQPADKQLHSLLDYVMVTRSKNKKSKYTDSLLRSRHGHINLFFSRVCPCTSFLDDSVPPSHPSISGGQCQIIRLFMHYYYYILLTIVRHCHQDRTTADQYNIFKTLARYARQRRRRVESPKVYPDINSGIILCICNAIIIMFMYIFVLDSIHHNTHCHILFLIYLEFALSESKQAFCCC